jgi:UDP-glucose:(heptosyl)LPS alpha-1,3-glucosyltransferase
LGQIILHQVREFRRDGYSVDIVLQTTNIEVDDANIIKIRKFPFGKYLSRYRFAKSVERVVEKNGYDLVIGHGDIFKQDILYIHNLIERAYFEINGENMTPLSPVAKLHRNILENGEYQKIVANSNLMRDELIESFNIPPEKIEVSYPPYDKARFNPENRMRLRQVGRDELGISQNDRVVGLVTSGDFKKRGVDRFFKALKMVDPDFDFKVLIVGKDKTIFRYIDSLQPNLKSKIIYREPIFDVEKYLSVLDLLIYPAYFEEFGMVVQEANALGVPIFLTPNIGASELVK